MRKYKLAFTNAPTVWKSNDLDFLIQKVEFFNSCRSGVKAKPRVICCNTGVIVYE